MSFRFDIAGQKFGAWTVREYVGGQKWLCRCACGTEKWVSASNLRRKQTRSCGKCRFRPFRSNLLDLVGQRFGHLVVLEYVGKKQWRCACDCGGSTVARTSNLKQGLRLKRKSTCGCMGGFRDPSLRNRRLVSNDEAAVHRLWVEHNNRARHSGQASPWDIPELDFRELILSPCHYCGDTGSNILTCVYRQVGDEVGEFRYNGLDRVESDGGYVRKNLVPCCWECNRAKGKMSYKKFCEFIKRIAERLKLFPVLAL